MAANNAALLGQIKPKMLAASLRAGETDPKPLGDDERRRRFGRVITRALELAHLTKQEASFAMGYEDQSSISKWISGKETAQIDRLMEIPQLRPWLPVALAELAGQPVEIETVVRVRRTA